MRPTVSVIIPTCNRNALLNRAIQSVLSQKYRDFECIVVDDGSNIHTKDVTYSYDDNRLTYFRHKINMGASAARNTGIRHAKGELIAFLDDDDEWISSKLEKQVPLLQGLPERFGMVYCWMDTYNEKGVLVHEHHPTLRGDVFPQLLDAQRLGGCPTLLVRRGVIEKVGGFDESLPRGNDGDFIRRVCKKYEVNYIPEVLVKVHTGHCDRIGLNTRNGLNNHIYSAKTRLVKFRNDFEKYPEAKANLYFDIANTYLRLRNYTNSLLYYLRFRIVSKSKFKGISTLKKLIMSELRNV